MDEYGGRGGNGMFDINECVKNIADISEEFMKYFKVNLDEFRLRKFETPDEMWEAVMDEVGLSKEKLFCGEVEFDKLMNNYFMFESDIYIWAYYLLIKEIDEVGFCSNYYNFFNRRDERFLMKTNTMFCTNNIIKQLAQEETKESIICKYGLVRNMRMDKWSYCKVRSIEEKKDFTIVDRIQFYLSTDCSLARMVLEDYLHKRDYDNGIWKMLNKDEVFGTITLKRNDNDKKEVETEKLELDEAGKAFIFLVKELNKICGIWPFAWRYHYYYNCMDNWKVNSFSIKMEEENRKILEKRIEINERLRILLRGYIYCIYSFPNWKEYVENDLRDKAKVALENMTVIFDGTDEEMMQNGANTSVRMWDSSSKEQKLYTLIQAAVISAIAQNREG